MGNPYKEYYEASQRNDEWAEEDKRRIRERIRDLEESCSWNGSDPYSEAEHKEEYNFGPGA